VSHNTEVRAIWWHSQVYGLGSIVNRAAGLVLLPIYTHVLTADEFGLNALITIVTELMAVPLGMGLGNALIRFYIASRDEATRRRVVSTAFLSFLALAAVFSLLAAPAAYLTCRLIFSSSDHHALFTLAYLGLIFTVLFNMELQYIRAQKRSVFFLIVSTGRAVLFMLTNLYFVLVAKLAVAGIVYGTLLAAAVISLPVFAVIARETGFRFSLTALREMVVFGLPTIPAVLLDTALSAVDKYYINRFLSVGAVGPYALSERLVNMLRWFVTTPFGQIWVVRRLEVLETGDRRDTSAFEGIFVLFHAVLTGVALTLVLFAPEVLAVVAPPSFAAAAAVVPFFAVSQVLFATQMHFEIGIYHAKQTRLMPLASGIALAVSILANYFLTQRFGIIGAAAGSLLATCGRTATVTIYATTRSGIGGGFGWTSWLAILMLAAGMSAISFAIFGISVSLAGIAVKAALIAIFSVILAAVFLGRKRASKPTKGGSPSKCQIDSAETVPAKGTG
jgi:O-antigen/teichoic acid export membrane protein